MFAYALYVTVSVVLILLSGLLWSLLIKGLTLVVITPRWDTGEIVWLILGYDIGACRLFQGALAPTFHVLRVSSNSSLSVIGQLKIVGVAFFKFMGRAKGRESTPSHLLVVGLRT